MLRKLDSALPSMVVYDNNLRGEDLQLAYNFTRIQFLLETLGPKVGNWFLIEELKIGVDHILRHDVALFQEFIILSLSDIDTDEYSFKRFNELTAYGQYDGGYKKQAFSMWYYELEKLREINTPAATLFEITPERLYSAMYLALPQEFKDMAKKKGFSSKTPKQELLFAFAQLEVELRQQRALYGHSHYSNVAHDSDSEQDSLHVSRTFGTHRRSSPSLRGKQRRRNSPARLHAIKSDNSEDSLLDSDSSDDDSGHLNSISEGELSKIMAHNSKLTQMLDSQAKKDFQGRCYRCNEYGHMARECTNKAVDRSNDYPRNGQRRFFYRSSSTNSFKPMKFNRPTEAIGYANKRFNQNHNPLTAMIFMACDDGFTAPELFQ
jgi:hypothetical protein